MLEIFIAIYFALFLFFVAVGIHHVYTKLDGKLGFIETGIVLMMLLFWPIPFLFFALRRNKDDLFKMSERELSRYLVGGLLINNQMRAFEFRLMVITPDGKLRKNKSDQHNPTWGSRKGDMFIYAVMNNETSELKFCKSISLVDNEDMNINQAVEIDKTEVKQLLEPIVPPALMYLFTFNNKVNLIKSN